MIPMRPKLSCARLRAAPERLVAAPPSPAASLTASTPTIPYETPFATSPPRASQAYHPLPPRPRWRASCAGRFSACSSIEVIERQRRTGPRRCGLFSKDAKTRRLAAGSREAAGLGFEPRLLGPEPSVLPLDDPATCRCGAASVAPLRRRLH